MSEDDPNPLRDAYLTHVMGMGQVAFMWNDLHEALGELFSVVAARSKAVGMAVWYSTPNDRAQRDMLRDALKAIDKDDWTKPERARSDLLDMLQKVNNLSDGRNNAIHTPFEAHLTVEPDGVVSTVRIAPADRLGHGRAKQLSEHRDLLQRFQFYAATAQTLARYFRDSIICLQVADQPWPEKPRLPSLSPKKSHKR